MSSLGKPENERISLFLCGDVMLGRGIDQILPQSVDPQIYESYVQDARHYVTIAEQQSGKINQPVSYSYIWGDDTEVWDAYKPRVKLINLETAVTDNGKPQPYKGIHYRMHPSNVEVLKTAGIDFCSLANNHILDWHVQGLQETLRTLKQAGISHAGAGMNLGEARAPGILSLNPGRILIFSYGATSSGIPGNWSASSLNPGINLLDFNNIEAIRKHIHAFKKPGDMVLFSVHWGSNWGYHIPERQVDFAHQLIDSAGVDIIHGHSSHHPLGIEVYKEKLIVYGAGDFINDYEGIGGHEQYRSELTLMYFPVVEKTTGNLHAMQLVPMRIKKFQLQKANGEETGWLAGMLNREGEAFGTKVTITTGNALRLQWE